jgi:hypothetical protein
MNARCYTSVVTLACVLLVVVLSAGCEMTDAEDESEQYIVEVHLQTGFGGAHVLVSIDERVVFDDALPEGEPFSGPVKTITVEEQEGRHRILVGLDGATQEETTFTVDGTLYIGVQNTSTGIVFTIQKTPFLYL